MVIPRTQHDLKRPSAPHEASEVLDPTRARDHAKGRLELTEHSRLARGEAHVACEHKLATDASYATFDLSNRDEAACAQVMEQEADRLFVQLRRLLPQLFDPRQIDVG